MVAVDSAHTCAVDSVGPALSQIVCAWALQGFTKEITMPREQWVGYIKDYDGGTLMEYVIHPKIPYADLVGMFKASVPPSVCWGLSAVEQACHRCGSARLSLGASSCCVFITLSRAGASACAVLLGSCAVQHIQHETAGRHASCACVLIVDCRCSGSTWIRRSEACPTVMSCSQASSGRRCRCFLRIRASRRLQCQSRWVQEKQRFSFRALLLAVRRKLAVAVWAP